MFRVLVAVIFIGYIAAGLAAVSLEWFPPGWADNLEVREQITGENKSFNSKLGLGKENVKFSPENITEWLKNKTQELLVFLSPREVANVLSSKIGLARFAICFAGLFLLSWLKA